MAEIGAQKNRVSASEFRDMAQTSTPDYKLDVIRILSKPQLLEFLPALLDGWTQYHELPCIFLYAFRQKIQINCRKFKERERIYDLGSENKTEPGGSILTRQRLLGDLNVKPM